MTKEAVGELVWDVHISRTPIDFCSGQSVEELMLGRDLADNERTAVLMAAGKACAESDNYTLRLAVFSQALRNLT